MDPGSEAELESLPDPQQVSGWSPGAWPLCGHGWCVGGLCSPPRGGTFHRRPLCRVDPPEELQGQRPVLELGLPCRGRF